MRNCFKYTGSAKTYNNYRNSLDMFPVTLINIYMVV